MTEGYDAVFQTEVDKKYTCPVCLAVLRDAVQTHCGHRFCKVCIANVIGNRLSARCPVDNTSFTVMTQLFEDNAMRREVLSLGAICCYQIDGCLWTGELRDFESHKVNCSFRPIECTFDCGNYVKFFTLQGHLLICPRRPELCTHCEKHVAHIDMTKHQLLLCQKIPVNCLLCGSGISRENIARHVDVKTGDCPNISIKCNFQGVGCHYEERRGYMGNHYAESIKEHLSLVLVKMTNVERSLTDYQSTIVSQQNVIKEQGLVIRQLEDEKNRTGHVHWKIPVPGMCVVASSIFYTGVPGYKLRIELDSRGSSQFTELLVFLHDGEYDEELLFPCYVSCRLTVYHAHQCRQSNIKKFVTSFPCFIDKQTGDNDRKLLLRQRIQKTETLLSSRFKSNGHIYVDMDVTH